MAAAARNAFAHDALLPRAPGGNGPGALLALLVHAGLIVALTLSVDWRSKAPEAVSAELWASVPQAAAPRPEAVAVPQPPPQPAPAPTAAPAPAAQPPARQQADIAIEREQRRQADAANQQAQAAERERQRSAAEAERKQADAAKKKREQDEQRQTQAAEARLAQQRQENLKRMMGQADAATGSAGTALQSGAPSAAYSARVAKLIRDASVFTGSVAGNPAAEVLVRTGPSGTIIARTLVKSSGFKQWDDAVLQAIDKVGSLPRDTDGRVPPAMTIIFRPNE